MTPTTTPEPRAVVRAATTGAVLTVVLVVASFTLPHLLDIDTLSRRAWPGEDPVPPLRGYLDVKPWTSAGTLQAVAVGVLAWALLPRVAATVRWPVLLASAYGVGLVWLLALAYVDGADGIARVEAAPDEYLQTATAVTDVPALLDGFVGGITYGEPDSWPTHVAGHPPGALLFFVALVRAGIDTPYAVGLAVTFVAATTAPAALVTLRALGAEDVARRACPFVVLAPAAVLMAVSADAVFAAVTAWGLAALAVAATSAGRVRSATWAVAAGLLLGLGVFMSYGLVLMGPVALGVLAAARSWRPLPWAVGGALLVVAAFGAFGFFWWEAYGPLTERYQAGLGGRRPQSYWVWGNIGALLVAAGPAAGIGLACTVPRARAVVGGAVDGRRTAVLLALSAALALAVATLSGMSKSEVERIWLPWMPWLLVATALLPPRWRTPVLLAQVTTAVVLQQLVFTQW